MKRNQRARVRKKERKKERNRFFLPVRLLLLLRLSSFRSLKVFCLLSSSCCCCSLQSGGSIKIECKKKKGTKKKIVTKKRQKKAKRHSSLRALSKRAKAKDTGAKVAHASKKTSCGGQKRAVREGTGFCRPRRFLFLPRAVSIERRQRPHVPSLATFRVRFGLLDGWIDFIVEGKRRFRRDGALWELRRRVLA